MRKNIRIAARFVLLLCALATSGCSNEVGVGISVGVPVGTHGHMSVGTSRWY